MTTTLASAWETTVKAAPTTAAILDVATGAQLDRSELDARAAHWRNTRGAKLAGQTVVVAESNSLNWFVVFIGLLKSNAVIVPLDPGEPLVAQVTTAHSIRAAWLWSGGELRAIAPRGRPARDGRRIVKLTSGSTGTPRSIAFTDA